VLSHARRLLALALIAGTLSITAASPAFAATASAATVTHYTASYTCSCFGTFTIDGVHVTNKRFPGGDSGGGDAIGGRDNFSGTVSQPPAEETTWKFANAGEWCSDYDSQCTADWSVTFEPDGSLSGWAAYPNS
jgi:hypothetical protein